MKACVTGATGFVGAHVARLLAEGGHDVRVAYRNPDRLGALKGVSYRKAKADVLDYSAMRRAVRGCDVLFHAAGLVGSSPVELVWEMNAHAPVVAVEAAAAEGVRRVVLTSTISAIGEGEDGRPADEETEYPANWLGLVYPDSKHQGERGALAAGKRHGVEVVIVNPGYVLGVPVNEEQPGETSTRTIGNYLRGRLPAVVDAPMSFVDVEDVARGHLLAAERGKPGERYILGGENMTWPELVDLTSSLSGVRHPIAVLPRAAARVSRIREVLGLPGAISAEAMDLMGKEWRFSSEKAKRELGYRPRPVEESVRDTIAWYRDLIAAGAFEDSEDSNLSRIAAGLHLAARTGVLAPVRAGQRVVGRRVLAGG